LFAAAGTIEHELLRRLDELERRLRDTQAMAARAYEAVLDWPRELIHMRAEPDYADAFGGEPLVSVRVATFNRGAILCERSLASLLSQTYSNWEALVVGDACTDDTEERVRALGDERIRFWNLPFRGPYPEEDRARWYVAGSGPANAALVAARGSWIAPLDDDDEWDPDHIEALLNEAQHTRAEVVYGRIRVVDEQTRETIQESGAWPPTMGQFGFLACIQHRGLARFHYDPNCRFADEPGDWNLARRMWDAGVRFAFIDRAVATNYFAPRHRTLTTEQRMIEELRGWSHELEATRDRLVAECEQLNDDLVEIREWNRELEAERDAWRAKAEGRASDE
jgi:hypothetical protein